MADNDKVLAGPLLSGTFASISGPVLTILVFLIGQFTVALIWAVHQESRITATELAISQILKRQMALSANLDVLQTRVYSQDTPLSKRVDLLQDRTQAISERLSRLDSIVDQLRPRQ